MHREKKTRVYSQKQKREVPRRFGDGGPATSSGYCSPFGTFCECNAAHDSRSFRHACMHASRMHARKRAHLTGNGCRRFQGTAKKHASALSRRHRARGQGSGVMPRTRSCMIVSSASPKRHVRHCMRGSLMRCSDRGGNIGVEAAKRGAVPPAWHGYPRIRPRPPGTRVCTRFLHSCVSVTVTVSVSVSLSVSVSVSGCVSGCVCCQHVCLCINTHMWSVHKHTHMCV